MDDKLTFCYLFFTTNEYCDRHLIGVYSSLKKAKADFDMVNAESVTGRMSSHKRVLQKTNVQTGQIWYVEKHVVR